MRKTRRRKKKKKTHLCALSVHNNYTLARDRSFSPVSLYLSFCSGYPSFPDSLSWNLPARIRGCWTRGRLCPPSSSPSFPPSSSPEPVGATITAALFTRFTPSSLFFVWSVTIITLVTFLVYTSLYLVKFSKFTIKITCGFFCQSSGDNLALCNKYTICTR